MIFFKIHESRRLLITYSFNDVLIVYLRFGDTGNKNRSICLAAWLQNTFNSDVARFTTHENNLAALFLARHSRTWLVNRQTSLFNLVCSNVAKQVACFLLPVLLQLQSCFVQFLWCSNFCFRLELCRFWTTVFRYHHSFCPGMEFFVTEHSALVSLEKQV